MACTEARAKNDCTGKVFWWPAQSNQGMFMQAEVITSGMRPTVALADYDFLRATYDMLLRAPVRNQAAIDAAFEALDAAHARLKAAHMKQHMALMN
jgi:hypothetical protein